MTEDQHDAEQQARCRTLELCVLLRAFLDATWREDTSLIWDDLPPQRRSDIRIYRLRRIEARNWFLDRSDDHREHIDNIAARAGLPDGWVWALVRRFLTNAEDPAPIRRLYDVMTDRPGLKKFDFRVAFVA